MKLTINDSSSETVQIWVKEALELFGQIEDIKLLDNAEIILFSELSELRKFVNREVSSTMFMTPFCDENRAVIIALSPLAEPRNLEKQRFQRHFLHECFHIANWRKSGSKKVLGDGNKDIKIPPWQDEGIAEVYSLLLAGQKNKIQEAIERAKNDNYYKDLDTVDNTLNNLDDKFRARAFDHAVFEVWNRYFLKR